MAGIWDPCDPGTLEDAATGLAVEHVLVPYDLESTARVAAANDRPDWAAWLRTGRAGF